MPNGDDYGDAPPQPGGEDLLFYTSSSNKLVDVPTLVNPVPGPQESVGSSSVFSLTPSIVHFGGLKVGEQHEQVLSIVNVSKTSQRLSIYPATSGDFFAEYEKQGSLAPGMSQRVVIRFRPQEYKYYHDFLRIQAESGGAILVPIHAYPVLNRLAFPRTMTFGSSPLCEPGRQSISLKCSVPVDFSFEIEVTKPHPYFRIEPLRGIIPAKGETTITVTFLPITLGSCFLSCRLHVGQYGWTPLALDISAKAVSGLLESRQLKQAEMRLMDFIHSAAETINNNVIGPESSFRGDLTNFASTRIGTGTGGPMGQSAKAAKKNHLRDPTASLLASTFRAGNLDVALDAVLQTPGFLGTRVLDNSKANATGIRGVDGVLKSTLQAKPRGVGSGIAFDAGSQWMTLQQQRKTQARSLQQHSSSIGHRGGLVPSRQQDTLREGLRIPPNLDTFPAVNFVITQEPGKLKPKDLKVAIERNRADRELRAQEQQKIRAEGGGAGLLDIRGILAEERLNLEEGDPFKRQLREMAFLADVDDVEKQEAVKQFRISEEFIGSALLSEADIQLVYRQRRQALRHKQRVSWRHAQARQHTITTATAATAAATTATSKSLGSLPKAGAPAEVTKELAQTLTPSFDTNRNDVWSKRLNTLRRLISIVSRWIVRQRLDVRMGKVMARLAEEGVTTRDSAREFIALENANAKAAGPSTNGAAAASAKASQVDASAGASAPLQASSFSSVADLVCAAPNPALLARQNSEKVVAASRYEFTADMARRVLFPKFVAEESSTSTRMTPVSIDVAPAFDDRTFFPLKVRPEFVSMGYQPHKLPPTAQTFSTARGVAQRLGAAEESVLRPPADAVVKVVDLLLAAPPEPPALQSLLRAKDEPQAAADEAADFDEFAGIATPAWLMSAPKWSPGDLDFFRSRPEYRTYMQPPSRSEKDEDWELRPFAERLEYDEDNSLRSLYVSPSLLLSLSSIFFFPPPPHHPLLFSFFLRPIRWQRTPGFQSVNRYLLGGHETRSTDPPPPCGPTLIDFYMPDHDRHLSGLNCFARDHTRSLIEDDPDIAPLQQGQDKGDVLTDSESDDDDGYVAERPSIHLARRIFREPAAAGTAPLDLDPAASFDAASDGFGLLSPTKRREEQVELLRDRKTLDLESSLLRARQDREMAVAQRLVAISQASRCLLLALPVQLPFHQYEDEVALAMESTYQVQQTAFDGAASIAGGSPLRSTL